jgi:hypothetical protein
MKSRLDKNALSNPIRTLLLVLGCLFFVVGCKDSGQSEIAAATNQLEKIRAGLQTYAAEHNGQYPAMLSSLVPAQVPSESMKPAMPAPANIVKVFGPGAAEWQYKGKGVDQKSIVVMSPGYAPDGKQLVLRQNGTIELLTDDQITSQMRSDSEAIISNAEILK